MNRLTATAPVATPWRRPAWFALPLFGLLLLAPNGAQAQDPSAPQPTAPSPSASAPSPSASAPLAAAPELDAATPPPEVTATDERTPSSDPELDRLLELGTKTLREGALDLGLPLVQLFSGPTPHATGPDASAPITADGDSTDVERRLLDSASKGWALWLTLERASDGISVRLAGVRPNSRVIVVRREVVSTTALEVSVLRLLRDLDRLPKDAAATTKPAEPACSPGSTGVEPESAQQTDGRAYLAATGAAIGGYTGYALEHITGSNNPRVIYPLMTLGAGVGVAASLVAADEWQISTGEAWYLSAATLWGTASAIFVHKGLQPNDTAHRHAYGLLGTATGLSLGTLAVSTSEIGQGGALLTESGAIFGGLLGVLTERSIDANLAEVPNVGLGVGVGVGALGAGLLVTRIPNPSTSRVMYVDLSALLGSLTGAAVASPLIVGTKVTELETRLWLGSVLLGTLIGGGLGYTITSGDMATGARGPRRKAYAKKTLPLEIAPSIVPVRMTNTGPSTLTYGVQGVW